MLPSRARRRQRQARVLYLKLAYNRAQTALHWRRAELDEEQYLSSVAKADQLVKQGSQLFSDDFCSHAGAHRVRSAQGKNMSIVVGGKQAWLVEDYRERERVL
jgi:hypothetical protein